jgi:hypothetical protein
VTEERETERACFRGSRLAVFMDAWTARYEESCDYSSIGDPWNMKLLNMYDLSKQGNVNLHLICNTIH